MQQCHGCVSQPSDIRYSARACVSPRPARPIPNQQLVGKIAFVIMDDLKRSLTPEHRDLLTSRYSKIRRHIESLILKSKEEENTSNGKLWESYRSKLTCAHSGKKINMTVTDLDVDLVHCPRIWTY